MPYGEPPAADYGGAPPPTGVVLSSPIGVINVGWNTAVSKIAATYGMRVCVCVCVYVRVRQGEWQDQEAAYHTSSNLKAKSVTLFLLLLFV